MSTSTTFLNRFMLAENWDTETLINFLRDLNINLDENNFKTLRREKIDGQIFSDMTEKKFMKDGMKRGPAMKLEKQAKIFKEKSRACEKGKIEYFWLFPCGIWSIQHFISWSSNIWSFAIEREETQKKINFIFICQKCFKCYNLFRFYINSFFTFFGVSSLSIAKPPYSGLLKEMRHIRFFIIRYIFSVMI